MLVKFFKKLFKKQPKTIEEILLLQELECNKWDNFNSKYGLNMKGEN